MKTNLMKKLTALLLSAIMVLSLIACTVNESQTEEESKSSVSTETVAETEGSESTEETEGSESIEETESGEAEEKIIVTAEKDLHLPDNSIEKLSVAYYENQPEILLIEISYAVGELITDMLLSDSPNAGVSIEETETTVMLTRENGAYCEIDFENGTVFFSDFDLFNMNPQNDNPHDLLAFPYIDENGESVFIQCTTSFYTPGYGLLIDLLERNIPIGIYGGEKYIALQTFNDMFISSRGVNIAYNGNDLFLIVGNALSPDLAELYYHEEKTDRSEALAEFNFNELCLFLDLYYGLQFEHGFDDGFAYYLSSIGLMDDFLALDPVAAFNALGTLTLGYIADSHSSVSAASPYAAVANPENLDIDIAAEIIARIRLSAEYQTARNELLGEVNFYQKVGNTAFLTFDEFTMGDRSGGYNEESLQILDTITLIILAHEQITQDEEIENVVVDLSCNGGGALDSMIFLVAWMLGSCDVSLYNSITESCATTSYIIDANLDGIFDERDTITDKNLYCIISPVSFSCANYAPALLQASGKVTILGKTSSGGTCFLHNSVTADGTLFTVSDPRQMSISKNGTYSSVDMGVVPNVTLTKIESFYKRAELVEFLNNLK